MNKLLLYSLLRKSFCDTVTGSWGDTEIFGEAPNLFLLLCSEDLVDGADG